MSACASTSCTRPPVSQTHGPAGDIGRSSGEGLGVAAKRYESGMPGLEARKQPGYHSVRRKKLKYMLADPCCVGEGLPETAGSSVHAVANAHVLVTGSDGRQRKGEVRKLDQISFDGQNFPKEFEALAQGRHAVQGLQAIVMPPMRESQSLFADIQLLGAFSSAARLELYAEQMTAYAGRAYIEHAASGLRAAIGEMKQLKALRMSHGVRGAEDSKHLGILETLSTMPHLHDIELTSHNPAPEPGWAKLAGQVLVAGSDQQLFAQRLSRLVLRDVDAGDVDLMSSTLSHMPSLSELVVMAPKGFEAPFTVSQLGFLSKLTNLTTLELAVKLDGRDNDLDCLAALLGPLTQICSLHMELLTPFSSFEPPVLASHLTGFMCAHGLSYRSVDDNTARLGDLYPLVPLDMLPANRIAEGTLCAGSKRKKECTPTAKSGKKSAKGLSKAKAHAASSGICSPHKKARVETVVWNTLPESKVAMIQGRPPLPALEHVAEDHSACTIASSASTGQPKRSRKLSEKGQAAASTEAAFQDAIKKPHNADSYKRPQKAAKLSAPHVQTGFQRMDATRVETPGKASSVQHLNLSTGSGQLLQEPAAGLSPCSTSSIAIKASSTEGLPDSFESSCFGWSTNKQSSGSLSISPANSPPSPLKLVNTNPQIASVLPSKQSARIAKRKLESSDFAPSKAPRCV